MRTFKNSSLRRWVFFFALAVLAAPATAQSGNPSDGGSAAMTRVDVAKRYFHEVIDRGDVSVIPQIFAADGVQNFLGKPPVKGVEAMVAWLEKATSQTKSMKTDILDVISAGDTAVFHVRHTLVGKPGGVFATRKGIEPFLLSIDGKTVVWEAIVIFRFKGDQIVEEIVARDEVSVLMQLGTVTVTSP